MVHPVTGKASQEICDRLRVTYHLAFLVIYNGYILWWQVIAFHPVEINDVGNPWGPTYSPLERGVTYLLLYPVLGRERERD